MNPASNSSSLEQNEQQTILDFWFGVPMDQNPAYTQQRKLWFCKDDQTDEMIRQRFGPLYQQIAAGLRQSWQTTPQGCLALVIVLDQFSRNMFRDTPQAFATDPQALALAQEAIAQGFDQQLFPAQRLFFYLPLEHSESKTHQQQSVSLFRALAETEDELRDTYDYALKHQAVIEEFGRFPHRNAILGRPSTLQELEYLKQPGSSF